ncbi:MAG: RHS repeat-associated core domain-containing protein, partial [Terrimicrobiaceae bacterium]|nr:RHS repeat-associated core domain-containing protein [Terrimicrobiaceae bacterium]
AIQAREAAEAKVAAQVTSSPSAITHSPLFFTGKPLVEETGQYAFLFRHYDPELNRWTTSDPSGFPDGANNIAYMAVPTSEFDWQGLDTITYYGGDFTNSNGALGMTWRAKDQERSVPPTRLKCRLIGQLLDHSPAGLFNMLQSNDVHIAIPITVNSPFRVLTILKPGKFQMARRMGETYSALLHFRIQHTETGP